MFNRLIELAHFVLSVINEQRYQVISVYSDLTPLINILWRS